MIFFFLRISLENEDEEKKILLNNINNLYYLV